MTALRIMVVCLVASPSVASAVEGKAGTILSMTGDKRVKIAWQRDTSSNGFGVNGCVESWEMCSDANRFKLMGYDTATDTITTIKSTLDNYSRPLITHDGSRVVYSDRAETKIFVVNWNGTGRVLVKNGLAAAVWFDPTTSIEWVYYHANTNGLDTSKPLKRVNLDNTSQDQTIWNATGVTSLWASVSGDGTRIGGSFPWNSSGVVVPNGSGGGTRYIGSSQYPNGCWTSMAPDSSYRMAVFDGAHRNWVVRDSPGGASRTVNLGGAPGINGWEVYHPKHSNHVQFLTMDGPFSGGAMGSNNIPDGGTQVEVYFGKLDAGMTRVVQWVKLTNDSRADYYPTAWVDVDDPTAVQIGSFDASPPVIAAGSSTTLSWTTINATSVSIDSGVGVVSASGTVTVSPAATTTYTLTAAGPGGPVSRQVTVTVAMAGGTHLKINAGDDSPSVPGWESSSSYVTGGSAYDFSSTINLNGQPDPAPIDLYKTVWHLDHQYSFAVPNADYVVRLHFYDGGNGSGRAMDYTIEGALVLNDFNITAAAGGNNRVVIREFAISVGDGNGLQVIAARDGGNDVFEAGIEIISTVPPDTEAPTITIESPADGETVTGPLSVSGSASDNGSVATVEVSVDGGAFAVASGTSDWFYAHPTTLTDGSHTVRVRATDAAGNRAAVTRDFIVQVAVIELELLRPSGGESWLPGSTETIEWRANNLNNVTIFYSLDGGTTYDELGGTVTDTDPEWERYPWVVPDVPTAVAQIRIQGYFGETPQVSPRFSIIGSGAPEITLLTPAGGESYVGGDGTDIRWTAQDVAAVVLSYSVDDGATWEQIATVADDDLDWGAYPWDVPNVATEWGRVRVEDAGAMTQVTSEPFDITPGATNDSELDVTRVVLSGMAPDGSFETAIDLPLGVESVVAQLHGGDRRVKIQIESLDPPIEGMAVSARELREFLDGRGGILTWVDQAGRVQLLDFRNNVVVPTVTRLSTDVDCINPLISPDGTRVLYSQGNPNSTKFIYARPLSGGAATLIGTGDVGYWHFDATGESVIRADWSDKDDNGANQNTWRQRLVTGSVTPDGPPEIIHDRAMDAGPNRNLTWLGHVYDKLWAVNLMTGVEYSTDKFVLMDGSPADHQTCNGSLAPDDSARLMELVIPHDFIRVFSYNSSSDRFEESSRFLLPPGRVEWEFPDWSTHPDYATAAIRSGGINLRVVLLRVAPGEIVPELLEVTPADSTVSYSHLYVEP